MSLFSLLHESDTCPGIVPEDAGFLCDKVVVVEETIKGTLCITCHAVQLNKSDCKQLKYYLSLNPSTQSL
jgi:hypothetical protein